MSPNQPSAWLDYPHFYKFVSYQIYLNQDFISYNRVTYDLLQFMSDVGGIQTALFILFYFLIGQY
jgi:hypothetical protein